MVKLVVTVIIFVKKQPCDIFHSFINGAIERGVCRRPKEWEKIFLKKMSRLSELCKEKIRLFLSLIEDYENLLLEKCLKWKRGILLE